MFNAATAKMLGTWLENQLSTHEEDIAGEMRTSEDGRVRVTATISWRRITGDKAQIKARFKVPRESIEVEDVFDTQLQLPIDARG